MELAKPSQEEPSSLNEEVLQLLSRLQTRETAWLQVQGESMSPAIRGGDVVEIASPLRIKPGMIVLVNTPWGIRCHRVVSVENDKFTLKGDSLESGEQVLREQVMGQVRAVWRGKKRFSPYTGKWWVYGILQTRAPQLMHGLRKVWRWGRRKKRQER